MLTTTILISDPKGKGGLVINPIGNMFVHACFSFPAFLVHDKNLGPGLECVNARFGRTKLNNKHLEKTYSYETEFAKNSCEIEGFEQLSYVDSLDRSLL